MECRVVTRSAYSHGSQLATSSASNSEDEWSAGDDVDESDSRASRTDSAYQSLLSVGVGKRDSDIAAIEHAWTRPLKICEAEAEQPCPVDDHSAVAETPIRQDMREKNSRGLHGNQESAKKVPREVTAIIHETNYKQVRTASVLMENLSDIGDKGVKPKDGFQAEHSVSDIDGGCDDVQVDSGFCTPRTAGLPMTMVDNSPSDVPVDLCSPIVANTVYDSKTGSMVSPSGEVSRTQQYPMTTGAVIRHALKGGLRSFLLAYGLRSGMDVVLVAFQLSRGRSSLERLVRVIVWNADSVRFGVASGGFSFLWKLVNNLCRLHWSRSPVPTQRDGAIAGAVASLALLALPKSTRFAFSIQMLLRATQLVYCQHKESSGFQFPHGDALLFSLACAQIMYAALLRPDTLPRSYYYWIANLSQVSPAVLSLNYAVARDNGHCAINPGYVNQLCLALGGSETLATSIQDKVSTTLMDPTLSSPTYLVPCELFHPRQPMCSLHVFQMIVRVFRQMLPIHLALNGVPALVLKLQEFLDSQVPQHSANARSSLFLSIYCALFQAGICTHRRLANYPMLQTFLTSVAGHRLAYFMSGLVSALLAIHVEQKRRRGELALYVLPKAVESLYAVLVSRRIIRFQLPVWVDSAMGAVAFSALMAHYQTHSGAMNPTVRAVMQRLLGQN